MKVFGKDLYESEKKAVEVFKVLETVEGIEDLGVIRNIGQPELRIELDESRLARYGVAKEDVQSIIEMAIGGKSASAASSTLSVIGWEKLKSTPG